MGQLTIDNDIFEIEPRQSVTLTLQADPRLKKIGDAIESKNLVIYAQVAIDVVMTDFDQNTASIVLHFMG